MGSETLLVLASSYCWKAMGCLVLRWPFMVLLPKDLLPSFPLVISWLQWLQVALWGGSDPTACSYTCWDETGWGRVRMSEVIETRWPQHGQETIPSKVPLIVFWITRTMDWGRHNWVWDKPPVSRLKLSQLHQDLSPHLVVISRPGHEILSR